jgi:SAM-dependent methyltransferase
VDVFLQSVLTRPGNLTFQSHHALISKPQDVHLVRAAGGHLVLYGPHGRRILATDPDGNPLHECEWRVQANGAAMLVRARVQLDWGQWIGLKPRGLVNQTVLDLSRKPGWEQLRADDLRVIASQALRVPMEEVRFFYGDDDLVIDRRGTATIRHAKDAWYVLHGNTFGQSPAEDQFMACMGAMHWEEIDFLPVMELFQSLLPGTGHAVFELIRGLYDDQQAGRAPRPLRYRGLPTYPSEQAYRLFASFFDPSLDGRDPLPVFMDPTRSHEVTWLPSADPPLRYFDASRRLCVTVQAGLLQKATLAEDPAGVSFVKPSSDGFAPCGRAATAGSSELILREGARESRFPLVTAWGVTRKSDVPMAASLSPDWRTPFGAQMPRVEAREAYGAVLLYPEDRREMDEAATQPFVADHLDDQSETEPELAAVLRGSSRLLIDRFDAVISTLIKLESPRDYRILYARPALAQKQAQVIWNQLARSRRLDRLGRLVFVHAEAASSSAYRETYDVIYRWVPFASWDRPPDLAIVVQDMARALRPGGLGFLAGPKRIGLLLQTAGLEVTCGEDVETLPGLRMHRTILPQATVRRGLTVFRMRRG